MSQPASLPVRTAAAAGDRPVCIAAAGARTALGRRAADSAAALRAGIGAARRQVVFANRPWTLRSVARAPGLDERLAGAKRLLALALPALREACEPIASEIAQGLRVPLYIGLPELRPGFEECCTDELCDGLQAAPQAPRLGQIVPLAQGHAAGFAAFVSALARISSGELQACLVGGVDSYLEPATLDWLDRQRRIAGGDSRSAFVPGEGAGFCLLLTEALRHRLAVAPSVRLVTAATATEAVPLHGVGVPAGRGLTAAVRAALTELPTVNRIDTLIGDVNGERYRGEEWGFVCLRTGERFANPTAYLSPADCWGDVGAASAPLFVMLACQAVARGYVRGRRTLAWAGSDRGLRGVALLEHPMIGEQNTADGS